MNHVPFINSMMYIIQILNGPNLNLLGSREPQIYGERSFEDWLQDLRNRYPDTEIRYTQSNHEGDLVDMLQYCGMQQIPVILNAGAYTHTSVALANAIAAAQTRVAEVHISNIYAREDFRHTSYISHKALALISGLGLYGYEAALCFFREQAQNGSI